MNAPTDAGGIGYKISAPELNGRSIDGFRIFKFLGGSDTVRRIMNVIYAQYAGVFGDGTDMTTRTNNMYGQPYVNSVTFAYDTTTAITFTGTVNVTKTTRVEKGVSFIGGTFNFNGNIMDADPDQIIFSPTTTVTNIRSKFGYIPAKWFGVTANGTTNDYAALTKAIAATPADLQVGLPQGKTMVGSTLNISKSIIGLGANKSSSLIYNTAASGTDLQLGNITSDSVKISNILFSGSNKCRIGVIVNNNVKGVEVAYCTFRDVEQQGSELNNSAGLVIQNGGEGIWIHHNYFTAINAKNNGISRGIWGAGSGISPKKVIVENNIFDGISNIGSASLDADQLVVQGYTDSAGMIIRNNDHYNIYKRGVKLQCAGVIVQGDRFWSTAYRSGIVANSAISLYAKQTQALGNFVYDGAYEAGAIEAGTGDGTSTQDVTIRFNYINSGTSGSQPARRGIVVYGTNNKSIAVDYNTIYNGDLGISMPGNGRGISVIGNKIYNTSDNSIKIRPANSYPNNWNYGVQMIGNYVFKCGQAAYAIGNINGGSFIGNMIDSCSDDFILNYAPYIDSLIGFTAIGNTSSPFGYGSGKRVNFGNYSQRLPFANATSCPGLQYVAADSSNATYLYQGGVYVKIGAAVGTGVISVSAGNGMNFTTITGTGSVVLGTPSTLTTSTTNSSSGTTHTHALDLSGRTLTAGNGLTGGGTLGADRTFTLGTPSNITLSSTNSVTGTTHTHAFVPGGTAGQLIRGNGTLSTALSSTGYVKFNSGTNDYSTSSTVPYSDISGNKPTSGEYVADTLYTFPVLTSFTADTLIYTVIEDKVHVAGSFQVTTDGSGGYVIDIEFPPGLESYYTGFPGFIYGSGGALTVLGSNPLPVTIFGGGLNNPGGVRLTFTGGASTTYNVIFSFDYKIIPND